MKQFIKGTRVRLSKNVLHPEYSSLTGIVEKTVKSRGMVVVRLDNGKRYDAYPQNVIKEVCQKCV